MGVQVIPIPTEVVSHSSHSHSQFCVLFPFPWDSHGIPGPIGNPIPMHISTTYTCILSFRRFSGWCFFMFQDPQRSLGSLLHLLVTTLARQPPQLYHYITLTTLPGKSETCAAINALVIVRSPLSLTFAVSIAEKLKKTTWSNTKTKRRHLWLRVAMVVTCWYCSRTPRETENEANTAFAKTGARRQKLILSGLVTMTRSCDQHHRSIVL